MNTLGPPFFSVIAGTGAVSGAFIPIRLVERVKSLGAFRNAHPLKVFFRQVNSVPSRSIYLAGVGQDITLSHAAIGRFLRDCANVICLAFKTAHICTTALVHAAKEQR